MKALKKICFVTLLIGSLLTSVLFVQGQNAKTSLNDNDFSSRPYVYAGPDATICNTSNFETDAASSSAINIWITSGDGYFLDPHSLNTIYIPGLMDITNAQVVLSLHHTYGYNVQPISDEMILDIVNCTIESCKSNIK